MLYERLSDNIVSKATPSGRGALGIIRISGDQSRQIALYHFSPLKARSEFDPVHRKVYFGRWYGKNIEDFVDEIQIVFYRKPNSFSGEDMVEIFCHGGEIISSMILDTLKAENVRFAEKGEFSYRSFINGKMDLIKAQAINDFINSKTKFAAKFFSKNMKGELSGFIEKIRNNLLEVAASFEVQIDYPDEVHEFREKKEILKSLDSLIEKIEKVLEKTSTGKLLRTGIPVVIAGKPNVGKSSLLNRLLNTERAIVTEIPGTTRDFLEEEIEIGGIPVRLTDTAGIRVETDLIEKIGIEKTIKKIEEASLVLYLFDTQQKMNEYDIGILKSIKDKKVIVIINKSDLIDKDSFIFFTPEEICSLKTLNRKSENANPLMISTVTGEGIKTLEKKILDEIKEIVDFDEDSLITDEFQERVISKALEEIKLIKDKVVFELPYDIISTEIIYCLHQFDVLTGKKYSEGLTEAIFSNFCVGK